jgi:hypothetical protein
MGLIVAILLMLTTTLGQAQLMMTRSLWIPRGYEAWIPRGYGAPQLTANPLWVNSISNELGPYGSTVNMIGVNNPMGVGLGLSFVEPVFEPVEMSLEILETY